MYFKFKFKKNNKDIGYLDKELISKCIELISIICDHFPSCSSEILNKSAIIENINVLLEVILILL